jgi:hypothetical protein
LSLIPVKNHGFDKGGSGGNGQQGARAQVRAYPVTRI